MLDIVLAVVAGCAVCALLAAQKAKRAPEAQPGASGAESTPAPAPAPKRYTINLPHTDPVYGAKPLLSRFGIKEGPGVAVVAYARPGAFSGLPDKIQEALKLIYREGGTRGPEVAQLVSGTRDLKEGEHLLFVAQEVGGEPVMHAFLVEAPAARVTPAP